MMFDGIANVVYDRVGKDGLLHFAVCAILTAFFRLLTPWWIASTIVLLVSLWKEFLDRKTTGFSWKDVLCDVCGILIGM